MPALNMPRTAHGRGSAGAGSGFPTWRAGAVLNEWLEIAGTSGAGGATLDSFSGFCVKESTCEIIIAAPGGHSSSSPHDNRVVSLDLLADNPATIGWEQRCAASSSVASDVDYYADGKPASRHLYQSIFFVPQANRVMLMGKRFTHPAADTSPTIDGFNLDTNTWDAAGTWPSYAADGNFGQAICRSTGQILSFGNFSLWEPADGSFTYPYTTTTGQRVKYPCVHDSLRDQWVTLCYGNGEGSNTADGLSVSKIARLGSTQTTVTINSSAALTEFLAEPLEYITADYDVENDQVLIYTGATAGKVYILTPNSGTTWDMSVLTLGGGSATVTGINGPAGGAVGKLKYVPALRGSVLIPRASSNVFFLRTS